MFFSSIILMIAGFSNLIWGIVALAKDDLLVNQLLFSNLTLWGVLSIILGCLLIVAGAAVLNKVQWARYFGLVFCSLSIIFYLAVMWAHPYWSLIVIIMDILVIYGLGVYGEKEAA